MVKWLAPEKERLCSATKFAKSTSALVTEFSKLLLTLKKTVTLVLLLADFFYLHVLGRGYEFLHGVESTVCTIKINLANITRSKSGPFLTG